LTGSRSLPATGLQGIRSAPDDVISGGMVYSDDRFEGSPVAMDGDIRIAAALHQGFESPAECDDTAARRLRSPNSCVPLVPGTF